MTTNPDALCNAAAHALTAYDRKRAGHRNYNPNALAAYLAVVNAARKCRDIDSAARVLIAGFSEGSHMHDIVRKLTDAAKPVRLDTHPDGYDDLDHA